MRFVNVSVKRIRSPSWRRRIVRGSLTVSGKGTWYTPLSATVSLLLNAIVSLSDKKKR